MYSRTAPIGRQRFGLGAHLPIRTGYFDAPLYPKEEI
jgi:hypothetical protein